MRDPVERGYRQDLPDETGRLYAALVDTKKEIREFLTTRRAHHARAGGARLLRQPPRSGLRREEVAVLASVSVPYYTRLERGDMSGASANVLEALARAHPTRRRRAPHLFDLARSAQPMAVPPRRRQAKQRVRPEVNGHSTRSPAPPHTRATTDSTSWPRTTSAGRCSPSCTATQRDRRITPFVFLDPHAEAFYADWERAASECVAILRSAGGRDPYDRDLSTSSASLRRKARHSASGGPHTTCASTTPASSTSTIPSSARLSLNFNRLDIAADHGLTIFTYAAEPGSRSEEALKLLGELGCHARSLGAREVNRQLS